MFPTPPDADLRARLHQLARAQAARLRHQAEGEVWRSVSAWVQRLLSPTRLAAGE